MYTRRKTQSLFPIDTLLSNRTSLLSIVPELESPSTLLAVPGFEDKKRPVSEITEILDENSSSHEDEDDLSEFEEDSEGWSFESVRCLRPSSLILT